MTRAKDISKILTDANISGTLDVSGAFTSQGIDDNADATAITITSAELVGIGTSSPNSKLTSQTATSSTSAFSFANQLNNSNGSNDSIVALGFHNRADVNADGVGGAIALSGGGNGGGSGNLIFCIKDTSDIANTVAPSDEKMRIDSSGQIIAGAFGGNSNAIIAGSSSPGYTNQPGTNLLLKSGDGSGTGSSFMSFSTSPAGSSGTTVNTATERMRIDASGRVGVNTSSPDSKLHVVGRFHSSSNNATTHPGSNNATEHYISDYAKIGGKSLIGFSVVFPQLPVIEMMMLFKLSL